jgi:hypothetical protein
MEGRLPRQWRSSTREDDLLPRTSSGAGSRYSSFPHSSVVVEASTSAGTVGLSSCPSTASSRGAAKVTLLRFVRGGGDVGGWRCRSEVLANGRQNEESRDTSKSRYFVPAISSKLEDEMSSLALSFDGAGEPLGALCGEATFSSTHSDIGERFGDGVSPVRSMVSTMGCVPSDA